MDPIVFSTGVLVLAVTIVVRQEIMIRRAIHSSQVIDSIKVMHEHADDFDFGTKETNERLIELEKLNIKIFGEMKSSNNNMHALVHYVKFYIEKQTGEKPPPVPPNGNS